MPFGTTSRGAGARPRGPLQGSPRTTRIPHPPNRDPHGHTPHDTPTATTTSTTSSPGLLAPPALGSHSHPLRAITRRTHRAPSSGPGTRSPYWGPPRATAARDRYSPPARGPGARRGCVRFPAAGAWWRGCARKAGCLAAFRRGRWLLGWARAGSRTSAAGGLQAPSVGLRAGRGFTGSVVVPALVSRRVSNGARRVFPLHTRCSARGGQRSRFPRFCRGIGGTFLLCVGFGVGFGEVLAGCGRGEEWRFLHAPHPNSVRTVDFLALEDFLFPRDAGAAVKDQQMAFACAGAIQVVGGLRQSFPQGGVERLV